MPRTRLRRPALAGAWAALILSASPAQAGSDPPSLAIKPPRAETRQLVPPRSARGASADPSASSGGWWLGTAGIAAALAVFGGASVASKRFLPSRDSGPIQVVGRAALSPKHSACLVRVGDRVLIVGIGPQGSPATLGEVTDPAELARLAPHRVHRAGAGTIAPAPASTGFDRRIGDDE